MLVLGWVLAAFAFLAATVSFGRYRSESSRVAELRGELEGLGCELKALEEKREQVRDEHRRRGEELADLRKRLEKTKRSRGVARERERTEPGQIEELERTLELRAQALTRAREELQQSHRELARVHATLEHEREAARGPREEADARAREATTRLGRSEVGLSKAREDLGAERHELMRWRKRAENLDKVYMVLRGEHELAKDQLRAQQQELERLRALKVALVDPEPETEEA